jgi:hypothetical protein
MNIKRTTVLVFSLRAAMLGVGCDGQADYGEQCNDRDDGACDFGSTCKNGLYCPQAGGTCEYVDGYPPGSTSTSPAVAGCTAIADAAACERDDEHLLTCDPASGGPPTASDCRELGSSNMYCCPFTMACEDCDASDDAADDASDDSAIDDAGDQ